MITAMALIPELSGISVTVVLITILITITLIMGLMLCICLRIKSKTNSNLNSSLNNSNNFLPLNSIRNRDLTNNLELIRYNGANGISSVPMEDTDNHLRHTKQMTLNRALPDIPSTLSSSSHSTQNEFDLSQDMSESNGTQHKSESSRRSSKPRAPQPPNSRQVLTCGPVSDVHHPYARIKDNAIIDSSTENDTDDYCDPQLCTASNSNQFSTRDKTESIDGIDMSPPVPAKRFTNNELNSDLGLSASEEIPYMTPPPVRLVNADTLSHSSNDDIRVNASKVEISYNTISVREPLAKVLAERANSEHHYNEVEEERVSSFYEEIAGSTASSVTYSKIGDVLSSDSVTHVLSQEQQTVNIGDEPPALPSIESLMQVRADSSSSASPQQSITSIDPISDSLLINNYPKDLYSSVDKKAKTKSYNRQTIHCVPDVDNEFNNLYAKVQKSTHNIAEDNKVYSNQRPSSASEDRCDSHLAIMLDNAKPPPLPPPLNKGFHPRSSRTISMFDSSNSVPNCKPFSHQRRYSSGNQSFNANEWRKEQNDDYLKYESFRNNDIDLESDPGYEVIKKKTEIKSFQTQPEMNATNLLNGVLLQPSVSAIDPGYEEFGFDESDDPAYETISKKVVPNNDIEIIEPGYEVIKRAPHSQSSHFELNITRNVSDVSEEPGYERIRFTQKCEEEIESEPKYASISRTVDFFEDDEEEERLTERL